MEKQSLTEAFEEALSNPKVVTLVADLVANKMISNKANPKNVEAKLTKEHVVFAQEGSETGVWLTVKEISDKISEFKEVEIRPRVFGKALMADAVKTKDSAMGRKYFIESVLKEINSEVLDTISKASSSTEASKTDVVAEEVTPEYIAKNNKADSKEVTNEDKVLSLEYLNDMSVKELLEVNKSVECIKSKKAKKLNADELREALVSFLELDKVDASDVDSLPTEEELAKEKETTEDKKDKKKSKKDKKKNKKK